MNAGEWCPSQSWACFGVTPFRRSTVAQVWRNVWKLAQGTPAEVRANLDVAAAYLGDSAVREERDGER